MTVESPARQIDGQAGRKYSSYYVIRTGCGNVL